MKKQILFLSCLVGAVLLTSCEKETLIGNESIDLKEQTIKKVVFNLPSDGRSFGTSGTMLSFSSYEEYESTIDNLITAVEAHEDAFFSQYDNLSNDEVDDIIDSVGFDEHQPLIDFENQMSFTNSKRKVYRVMEDAWLLSDGSNLDLSPDKDNVFDIYESTLLNEMGEVMIAGRVYSFDKIDYEYEIVSEYENSLIKINNGEDVTNDPNINTVAKHNHHYCRLAGSSEDIMYFPNNPNRRVKRVMKFQHNFWGNIVSKTIIISEKKGNNGSWSRSRSNIGLNNETIYNEGVCTRINFQNTHNINYS